MADVSHELGALRFVVESPLSSKVAMFNNQAQTHKTNQLLNPFSGENGRVSPKPQFSKDQYGKPLAGSLTEMRGNKANIHVMKEMVELCQIINSEGYEVKDEPNMRVIPFGELFNIYNYISDKVVGILLRARKHKLVEFEGEMLFQRRDDDVPVFLLKPIREIRQELEGKMEELKRAASPAPQATSVLLDRSAHEQKLKEQKLGLPQKKSLKSRTPSPVTSRAATPTEGAATPVKSPSLTPDILLQSEQANELKKYATAPTEKSNTILKPTPVKVAAPAVEGTASLPKMEQTTQETSAAVEVTQDVTVPSVGVTQAPPEITVDAPPKTIDEITEPQATDPAIAEQQIKATSDVIAEIEIDINNNNNTNTPKIEEPPTVVIEATAVYVRNVTPAETSVQNSVATEESGSAANSSSDVNAENITA